MRVLGVVIAGGQSSRMGEDKAFVRLGGVTLMERVLSRLTLQVDAMAINVSAGGSHFQHFGLPTIPDVLKVGGTPLTGLHAALSHAAADRFDAVVSVPCDTPFLPFDLVLRLTEAGEVTGAAHARSGGRDHYLTGMWSTQLAQPLERLMLEQDLRRVQDFCTKARARRAVWETIPHDPFLNVNTREDLTAAAKILEA